MYHKFKEKLFLKFKPLSITVELSEQISKYYITFVSQIKITIIS